MKDLFDEKRSIESAVDSLIRTRCLESPQHIIPTNEALSIIGRVKEIEAIIVIRRKKLVQVTTLLVCELQRILRSKCDDDLTVIRLIEILQDLLDSLYKEDDFHWNEIREKIVQHFNAFPSHVNEEKEILLLLSEVIGDKLSTK